MTRTATRLLPDSLRKSAFPITTNSRQSQERVVVGRFGTAFGVGGWIRVHSFTHPRENLKQYKPWLVQKDSAWITLEIDGCKSHSASLIARIKGIRDRDSVRQFTGCILAVHEKTLPRPKAGEYYWRDLTGLKVLTANGKAFGRVDRLIDNNARHILVVKPDKQQKEILIPWLPEQGVIQKVDLAKGEIVVDWYMDHSQ